MSTAKIGGVTDDLGMSGSDFSTAIAILFAGYISLQVPSNMVAARVSRPGVYICAMCTLWGLVSGCTGAVQGYSGLIVCRLILGFFEAAFFPGALYLLTMFYTKRQMALRTGILYSGSQLGNAFGGLFALACLQLEGAHGIRGWRWLFVVEGAMTVGFGLLFAVLIPNKPATFRLLDETEKEYAVYRLEADRATKDASDEISTASALKLAVTDPKVWFVTLALLVNFIASAVTNFFPIVIDQMGFENRTVSLALTAPPYILCVVVISLVGWHSDKVQERTYHVVAAFSVTIVANVIAVATTNTGARYFAMMLMPASFYSSSIVIMSWMSSTITGPHIKRAIGIAIINALSNTSNIWTAYLYFGAPRYTVAFVVNLVASVLLIVIVLLKRWYLKRLNDNLDAGVDLGPNGPTPVQVEGGFRFQL
jgi:MFS family permease